MASYAGMSTNKKGNVTVKNQTDAQIAKGAASLVNPIYKQEATNMAAATAANEASQRALQQGVTDTYNASRSALQSANAAEIARQQADTQKRGIALNTANRQNLTAAAQKKGVTDIMAKQQQQADALNRESALMRQQASQALKDMDFKKASQLITEANRLKARGQELFAKTNQYNWQIKQARSGGGGGGTPQPLGDPIAAFRKLIGKYSKNDINTPANTTLERSAKEIALARQGIHYGGEGRVNTAYATDKNGRIIPGGRYIV